jgi:hypothetical protein
MSIVSAMRYTVCAIALGGAVLSALASEAPPAPGQASFVQNGEAGFVVTQFDYALSRDAKETGACPKGMTKGRKLDELFAGLPSAAGANTPAAQQGQAVQSREAQAAASRVVAQVLADGRNACMNPVAAGPDPNFRTVEAPNIPAYGIDLDGQDSHASGRPAPGTCAHDDFRGFDGERGIDNQFFRVVGCSAFLQPDHSDVITTEMLTGAWGILIRLRGVHDIRNDDNVEVGFYASADPIQLGPTRQPLAFATYAMTQNPRFRATTRGRIVNGVLTTDPVDVRFWKTVNGIYLERPLRDARVRMTLSAQGALDGYLAGYTPVEDMYNLQYGYRNGVDGNGKPVPEQQLVFTAVGSSLISGHTCNGAYHALVAAADGHRDPATGRCTSISTQYRIRAIPAFVVDVEPQGSNAALYRKPN